jgi:EAL domain-containing protein (putative c-di-GMP-specific phosphodiesterase class I)
MNAWKRRAYLPIALFGSLLMIKPMILEESSSARCEGCHGGLLQPFAFSMAFQPIVDVETGRPYAYEALVRGPGGESAGSVLSKVTDENRYAFDQSCRVRALTLAAQLRLADTGAQLSINFMPGAVYNPAACIQLTLKTAREVGFPLDRITFEIVESEQVKDVGHLRSIVKDYRERGFQVAIDDFGASYSGLNLLADFPTDVIKLDMGLTRNLHLRSAAFAITKSMVDLSRTLGCKLVAEGVESIEEYKSLRECGVKLMQGYLFAKPVFEALPDFVLPG